MRLIDHLCPRHADAALTRWPIAGNLGDLFDVCDSCFDIAARLHPEGNYVIRVLPDLDKRTYEYSDTIHESAHAVLGMLAGMTLNFAHIEPRTDGVRELGSYVNWADYRTPVDQWAAMCWAGQRAQMRWLLAEGLGTYANRIDVANMGWNDTKMVLESATKHGLPSDIGWDLCGQLLDEHWSTIERVADALLTVGRLSGDEIAAIAGLEVPA